MATAVSGSLFFSLASAASPKPFFWRRPASMSLAYGSEPAAVGISSESMNGTKLVEIGKLSPPPTTTVTQDAKVFDETVVEPRGLSDFIEQSRELVRHDGGPPRWISPLDCSAPRDTDLPSLFFLPGIDGVGMGLVRHHKRLGKIFDVWCLHIPIMDRTPFKGLVEYVERTVKSENHHLPNMPIYLVGESLGACIALAVAARNPNIDFVLILANPATCFSKSNLQYLSSFLDVIPEPMHIAVPYILDLLTGQNLKMSSAFAADQISITQIISGLSESLNQMLPSLSFLADILPKESLQWKLKMLKSASFYVDSRLHSIKAQTLLLASGRDQLFPSSEEARRLCKILPKCRVRHFNNSSHNLFLGEEYKLFWPEQAEFVRMASRFGATIVPFGVVGEDDIFEILIDYNDLRKIPFYDLLDKRLNQKAVRMRPDSGEEVGNQDLYLPGLLPKIPGRFYYLFGKPIETKGKEEVTKDREKAQRIYMHVKSEVENCISYLREKRKHDPFRNFLPRLLYQVSRGFTEEAPTFEL